MKIRKFSRKSRQRLMAAGQSVFPVLLRVFAIFVVAWLIVQWLAPAGAWPYTMAVFLGALFSTAMVMVLLATSRDLSDLANMQRRLESEHAVIALVFDARGRLLVHFQSTDPYPATSWPEYWVPPGGLVENGTVQGAAQERLRLLVDEAHPWGEAIHLASTNNSATYRRMNTRREQVPVQVDAYWVQWSDEDPWVPENAYNEFDRRKLRLASPNNMPEPVPPYYPELFDYLEAVRDGEADRPDLMCWTLPDTTRLEAMFQERV